MSRYYGWPTHRGKARARRRQGYPAPQPETAPTPDEVAAALVARGLATPAALGLPAPRPTIQETTR